MNSATDWIHKHLRTCQSASEMPGRHRCWKSLNAQIRCDSLRAEIPKTLPLLVKSHLRRESLYEKLRDILCRTSSRNPCGPHILFCFRQLGHRSKANSCKTS